MTDSHNGFTTTRENILDYLKALRMSADGLEVAVKTAGRNGLLHIRQGKVVAAECGNLQGNGALLTLAAMGIGEVQEVPAEKAVAANVSIAVAQIEGLFAKMDDLPNVGGQYDEERVLQEALRLFFQFRRKEAGAKLVQVLRNNRFYYPAWLWQSRLMTREDHLVKALNEARRRGNADSSIKKRGAEDRAAVDRLIGAGEKVHFLLVSGQVR